MQFLGVCKFVAQETNLIWQLFVQCHVHQMCPDSSDNTFLGIFTV